MFSVTVAHGAWTFVKEIVQQNPKIVAGTIIGIATGPFVAPVALAGVGFSAIGPVAGSLAAGWQAGTAPVAAGSTFAFFQSAAMGGSAAASGLGISSAAVGGTVGIALGVFPQAVNYVGRLLNQ